MTNPADQHSLTEVRRSADPPTLWLSLALGSVLIHLVLFILAGLAATQTAKVQLDLKPIAVEFVDPTAAMEQTPPDRVITARPGTPSASTPSSTQVQPSAPRSQSSDFNPPAEQPFTPLPVTRRRVPARPQPQQPSSFKTPVAQQPNPTNAPTQPRSAPFPQQPQQPIPSQSAPSTDSSPGSFTGSTSDSTPQPTGVQQPVESGMPIGSLPQGRSATVTVLDSRQTADFQKQPPRPINPQQTISIAYPSELANQTISLETNVYIDPNGLVLDAKETKLLSEGAIDQETLDKLANDIFKQWTFAPAQDIRDGQVVTPPISTLRIKAQVQPL